MKTNSIYLTIIIILLSVLIYTLQNQKFEPQLFQQENLLQISRQRFPDHSNTFSLKKLDGDWAVVSISFAPGGGAELIAKREHGIWREVFAGNDLIDCAIVEKEKIPEVINGECMDYETGEVHMPDAKI